ncbi:MAG: hypothetical protein J3K34DRAFT_430216 [Monoraphidium minutum]|nr:MAG: hypothetical protein J3K34DRAFT_430216 [Monoraphidium minutum]
MPWDPSCLHFCELAATACARRRAAAGCASWLPRSPCLPLRLPFARESLHPAGAPPAPLGPSGRPSAPRFSTAPRRRTVARFGGGAPPLRPMPCISVPLCCTTTRPLSTTREGRQCHTFAVPRRPQAPRALLFPCRLGGRNRFHSAPAQVPSRRARPALRRISPATRTAGPGRPRTGCCQYEARLLHEPPPSSPVAPISCTPHAGRAHAARAALGLPHLSVALTAHARQAAPAARRRAARPRCHPPGQPPSTLAPW